MARLPRLYLPDQPFHVIQRGNNREPIFAADADYHFYLRCLQEAAETHSLTIHAYVLMTNHVHLLVTPRTEVSLAKTLQSLGRRYVQYFNFTYQRTGTLWEGRYKSTLIDSGRIWWRIRVIIRGRVMLRMRRGMQMCCLLGMSCINGWGALMMSGSPPIGSCSARSLPRRMWMQFAMRPIRAGRWAIAISARRWRR